MKAERKRLSESDGATSVLVVLMGFLVGTILVALVGKNPLNMYKALSRPSAVITSTMGG